MSIGRIKAIRRMLERARAEDMMWYAELMVACQCLEENEFAQIFYPYES